MTVLAGTLVTNVRDLVPDPVYIAGVPQPDADGNGLIRAATLYRWLDAGVRIMARVMGTVIEDWTAIAQRGSQPWYSVDDKFTLVNDAFSNKWPIDTISLVEADVIWPDQQLALSQSLWGYVRKRSDHIDFGLWPVPAQSDPATTLVSNMTETAPDPITVGSVTNFLSDGYVKIDAEILQYQQVDAGANTIGVLSRGMCGTTAATHTAGAVVQHLGLWLKGTRSPATITAAASVVELNAAVVNHLETFLLARCRAAENEHAEARALMQEFERACKEINADPNLKENKGQIRAFGEPALGPLGWGGRVIVP